MKIVAFIQMFNEVKMGNLTRCLDNCKQWADDIVIYDDGSTDNSVEVAERYTKHIIRGKKNWVLDELKHKQELLDYTLANIDADWIMWIDCDEIIDRGGTKGGLRALCEGSKDVDAYSFHEYNLWRGQNWHRLDSYFDHGPTEWVKGVPQTIAWFVRLWRVTEGMHFEVKEGVHGRLYPITIDHKRTQPSTIQVIHYGFHDYKNMMVKIGVHTMNKVQLMNCAAGNWILDERKCECELAPDMIFPGENVPQGITPQPTPRTLEELIPYADIKDEMTHEEWFKWWTSQPGYFTVKEFKLSRPDLIAELNKIIPTPKILEIGCGYGRELVKFAEIGNVVGLVLTEHDIKDATENLQKAGRNGIVKQYDGVNIPTAELFDIIYSCFVVQHNSKLQTFQLMVNCMHRLTPEGKILFEFFGPPHACAGRDNNYYSGGVHGKMYNNGYTEDELRLLAEQLNDFVPCKLEFIDKQKVGVKGFPPFFNYWVCIGRKNAV